MGGLFGSMSSGFWGFMSYGVYEFLGFWGVCLGLWVFWGVSGFHVPSVHCDRCLMHEDSLHDLQPKHRAERDEGKENDT